MSSYSVGSYHPNGIGGTTDSTYGIYTDVVTHSSGIVYSTSYLIKFLAYILSNTHSLTH